VNIRLLKNIITGVAAIDDMVKCAGVLDAQSTGHRRKTFRD
jgi:hypothetical protein